MVFSVFRPQLPHDADVDRTVAYRLEGAAEVTAALAIDPETGQITVEEKLDREQLGWLNLTVRATDSGTPARSSYADVFVEILDENDNAPTFLDDVSNLTVREDARVGQPVAKITAVDPDLGEFGRVTYFLDRRSSLSKFKIHPDTGEISVSEGLDREEQAKFNLIVQV